MPYMHHMIPNRYNYPSGDFIAGDSTEITEATEPPISALLPILFHLYDSVENIKILYPRRGLHCKLNAAHLTVVAVAD